MPIPARVAQWNKVGLNRVVRHVAPWMPGLGLVVHRGRRSGRTYQTPVNTFPAEDGFIIALTYGAENTDGIHETHSWGGLDFSGTVLDDLLERTGVGLDDSKLLWIPFVGADVLGHLVDTILDVGEGVSDSWEIELLPGTGNCWDRDCHGGKAEGNNGLELHLERAIVEGNERRIERVKKADCLALG